MTQMLDMIISALQSARDSMLTTPLATGVVVVRGSRMFYAVRIYAGLLIFHATWRNIWVVRFEVVVDS